jgi:hypothetical protein
MWGSAEDLDSTGGDWEPLDDSVSRFEPSGAFQFGMEIKDADLLRLTLVGNLVYNEVRRDAVIRPATRFSAPAPKAWSHHESLSSLLSRFCVVFLCALVSHYPRDWTW